MRLDPGIDASVNLCVLMSSKMQEHSCKIDCIMYFYGLTWLTDLHNKATLCQ
jgi:hypothetical protein